MKSAPTLQYSAETFQEIPMARLPATIGRAGDADVSVPDRWVSRHHCRIECVGECVVIRDLGSSHGTYVNGRRIDQVELHSGDRLGVGLTSFVAMVDDEGITLAAPCAM